MGIQKEPVQSPHTECGGAGCLPGQYMPTGPGGNMTIVNQNERYIIDNSFENTPCLYADMQSDDSHIMGVYSEQTGGM